MLFNKTLFRFVSTVFPASRRGRVLVAGAAVAALLTACIASSDGKSSAGSGGVSVTLQILPAALAKSAAGTAVRPIDSAYVQVSGAGMDTVRLGFKGSAQSLSILDLPAGLARRFEVRLFFAGKLLYSGAATADLASDHANSVSVNCLPDFSRLSASVHVPLDFPKTIAGGTMRLWNGQVTLTAGQTVNGELRNFRIEEVPGDQDYAVSIAFWDAAGDTLAKGFKPDLHIPKGQNVALVLPLTLAFSQLQLSMTVGEPGATSVVLVLPGGKRAPTAFGDAVFSEVYPIPTTEEGSDNGEWLELFNRVTDTLDVAGCQIIRDAGTSAGMNFTFPSGAKIPPGRGLVVGRSAVTFAQVTQSSALTLTNTSARLELACASLKVDTLRYSTSASDSLAARIATAKVAALKPSRLASRHAADAWCLASMQPVAGEFAATPGGIEGSCGE